MRVGHEVLFEDVFLSNNERRRQGEGGGGGSTTSRRRQQGAVSGDEVPVMVSTDTSEGSTESQGVIGARENATQGSPASERDDQRGGGGQMRPEHCEGHGPRRKGSSWRTPGQLAEVSCDMLLYLIGKDSNLLM